MTWDQSTLKVLPEVVPKSQEISYSILPPCFAPLYKTPIETKRCSGQINNCMSTNLWVSFQPSSGKTSNVHLFNRHQPLIFTVSFHSLLIIKQAKPAVLRNYQCHYFGSHFSWSISHGRRYVNKLTWPSTANLVWPWKIVDPAESIRILIGHSRIAIMAALGDASWQTDMHGGRS